MTSHRITGGGGVKLHVAETGNPHGRPILFIHGYSQCGMSWSRQLNSDLANDFRLIAMDLRGHGLSDKPLDGYVESKPGQTTSMPFWKVWILTTLFSAAGLTAR